jgi:hypothetical protein
MVVRIDSNVDTSAKHCEVTPWLADLLYVRPSMMELGSHAIFTHEIHVGSASMRDHLLGLAVFDLDGTLLRGPTVCEVLAQALGRLGHMRQLEALIAGLSDVDIAAAREEMVRW